MRIHCGTDYSRMINQISFYDIVGDKHIFFNFYSGESLMLDIGDEIPEKFIMKIENSKYNSFLTAIAGLLDSESITTEQQSKVEGKLVATEYHLEDLRKLLKIDK